MNQTKMFNNCNQLDERIHLTIDKYMMVDVIRYLLCIIELNLREYNHKEECVLQCYRLKGEYHLVINLKVMTLVEEYYFDYESREELVYEVQQYQQQELISPIIN